MDSSLPHSGVASGHGPKELAAEFARQTLAAVRADRHSGPLQEAVRLGRAAGLRISEMQRVSGFSRPTIYAARAALDEGRVPTPRPDVIARQALTLLCQADGAVPLAEISQRLGLDLRLIHAAVLSLGAQGMCQLDRSAGREPAALAAVTTEFGISALRSMFDDLYLRRAQGFSVYLRLPEEHRDKIERAAARVLGRHEHTVMRADVAPSTMVGPELALIMHAPTSRLALMNMRDVWREVLDEAKLSNFEPVIADVIPPSQPPGVDSEVLDAFIEAIAIASPDDAGSAADVRAQFSGGVDERQLAARCVTEAVAVLRDLAGNEGAPREVRDADDAFNELGPATAASVNKKAVAVKEATASALELAADRMGPFRGGELGSVRAPGRPPSVVHEVVPSAQDLSQIAEYAGSAVGRGASIGAVNVRDAVLNVVARH